MRGENKHHPHPGGVATPRSHTGQLTCPLENTNTRAAPAAVSPQVKRVPSKAWNTALWPRSMLDPAVGRGATGQRPPCLSATPTCSEELDPLPLSWRIWAGACTCLPAPLREAV